MASGSWEVHGIAFSHAVEIPRARILRVDITDYAELKGAFADIKPDAVLHIAAASKPNYCQVHPLTSRRVNVEASLNIAGLCGERGLPLVFTSTDLVFDGLNPPYGEEDPVCPINIYGEHKLLAEEGIADRWPEAAICRMPLMFGACGGPAESVLQPMLRSMVEGEKLRLFADEFRTPVSARAAGSGLLLALERGQVLLHLGGRERLSRYDFGMIVAKVFGLLDCEVLQCSAQDVPMEAPRAPDLSLDSNRAIALGFQPLTVEEELEGLRESYFVSYPDWLY
jgi:dTDP-4-dehydrorhamnose reductase